MRKKMILSVLALLCIGSTGLTSCMKDGVDGKDGINGVDGVAGKDGKDGVDGKDGTSIHTGEGAPSSELGHVGDLYVDSESGDLYSKDETGWTKTGNIKGAQGDTGETGAKGDDGADGKDGVSVVGTHIDENGDLICEMSDGTTINAGHVKDVTKHTVNFYVDDRLVYKTTVEDGAKVSCPDKEQIQGYNVNSWYSKEEGGFLWLFSAYSITSDLNLYADENWTGMEYTITLDSGIGTINTNTLTVAEKVSYELPTPTVPSSGVDEGLTYYYTFEGWYLNDTLIPIFGTSWTYSNSDATLVAKYTKVDCINYGIYPQSRITDENLIRTIYATATKETNGWYLYNGEYYAEVQATPYATNYKFDDGTTITNGEYYWFKCEPISWNILESNDGEYKLVSSVILGASCFISSLDKRTIDGKTILPNNYKYSDIRTWLNDDFYNSAFSLGNSYIQTVEVDNSAATTSYSKNSYACENTNDNVYLLSYQDYMNTQYFADKAARRCKTTDYARASGCYANDTADYFNNGNYWTRSPDHFYGNYGCRVTYSGWISDSSSVNNPSDSVRPAITVKFE